MALLSWVPSLLLQLATAVAPVETDAQMFHRKGVHCMDVLERDRCAVENLEALLDETTTERELVTDGLLRLIRLYRRAGDEDAVKPLLRRYWDTGMKRASRGHVPHSTRYLPNDLDVLFSADVQNILAAPITRRLGLDARDTLFTCDAARRRDINERRRWRRAKKLAEHQGRDFHAVLYEELEKDRKQAAEREARAAKGSSPTPLFFTATCDAARALGQTDLLSWHKVTAVVAHRDFGRSLAMAEIPKLDAQLAGAEADGRLVKVGPNRWALPEVSYAGGPVHLLRLDLDELTIAPASLADEIVAAHQRRQRTGNAQLALLLGKVPRDAGFFGVLTESAMHDLGMANVGPVLRGLLPRPRGLQIAGVFADDFGLFTRVPTDNPVKGRMLVGIVRSMIGRAEEEGSEAGMMLRGLDVAEAADRKALLATYLLSAVQVERFVLE